MRTFKELSGKSILAKNRTRVVLKEGCSFDISLRKSLDTQIVLNFAYVRIPYRFSQKETLISSKEPPGTSIRPQNKTKIQTNKNLSTLVSRLFERLSVLDFSHAKVLIKSLRDNKAVKGAVRYAKQRSRNGQNQPIKLF